MKMSCSVLFSCFFFSLTIIPLGATPFAEVHKEGPTSGATVNFGKKARNFRSSPKGTCKSRLESMV